MRIYAPQLVSALLIICLSLACSSDDPDLGTSPATEPSIDAGNSDSDAPGQGEVGDPCTTNADCADPPNAECFTDQWSQLGVTFPNGYCSKGCIEDPAFPEEGGGPGVDCGTGACIQESGGMVTTAFCAKLCDVEADCRVDEGYTCKKMPIISIGYCAPR